MAGVLVATIGATVASVMPLGSSSVLAAGSQHAAASTLLGNACSATFGASAFRLHGHLTSGGKAMTLDVWFGSQGIVVTASEKGGQTFGIIKDGPSFYMKANRSFWLSNSNNNSAVASLFAGRWIDMTLDKKDTAGIAKSVTKEALLGACQGGLGSATYAGKGNVKGVKVTKVHLNRGPNAGTFYIENGPTPYLLRATSGVSQKGDLVFSNYGVQPDIAVPAGAIPISQLTGNSGGTGTTGSTGDTGGTGNTGAGIVGAAPPLEPIPTSMTASWVQPSTTTRGPETVGIPSGPKLATLTNAAAGQTVDSLRCQAGEQTHVHVHTHLTIFVNGQARVIPYGIGIPGSQAVQTSRGPFVETGSCFYWLHTHANDGIIHVESPSTAKQYMLGQFFDEWGIPLSSTQVGPATGTVTAFFTSPDHQTGIFTGNPRDIPLGDHYEIQLDVGAPIVAPVSVTNWGGL
jgi:hypothetical protein